MWFVLLVAVSLLCLAVVGLVEAWKRVSRVQYPSVAVAQHYAKLVEDSSHE